MYYCLKLLHITTIKIFSLKNEKKNELNDTDFQNCSFLKFITRATVKTQFQSINKPLNSVT